jgi:CubicO group peptidase (beta-lactamase class C family)
MKSSSFYCLLIIALLLQLNGKAQEFTQLMNGYSAYNRFWGNILVLKGEKVLFQNSYGFADKENGIKNDVATVFNLASVTKTITGAAILRLHDQGKLSVYDKVDKYIPGFIADDTKDVKIINLLNHTSGLSANILQVDEQGNGLVMPEKKQVSMDSLLSKFRHTKLKFQPGTKFEYNNYAYTLLAFIIEQVSGCSYANYLKNEFFQQAKMDHTFYKPDLNIEPALAYSGLGTNYIHAVGKSEFHSSWIMGAGDLYSTTGDLANFYSALFTNQFFSEKTTNLMLDTCVDASSPNIKWALGWSKYEIEGKVCFTHSGNDNGCSTKIIYIPSDDIYVIILSNLSRDTQNKSLQGAKFSFVDDISDQVVKLIQNKEVSFLPLPKGKANKKLSGNFDLDEEHNLKIAFQNDSLFLSADQVTLFDYTLYRSLKEESENIAVCRNFNAVINTGELNGFEKNVTTEMQENLFNKESIGKLVGGWKNLTSGSGKYQSFTIYKVNIEPGNKSYRIAYHFEKSDILMTLSFNDSGLMQGLFITNILPKCTVAKVALIPVATNKYFVDGYSYGGYKDYLVEFEKSTGKLSIKAANEEFSAVKID